MGQDGEAVADAPHASSRARRVERRLVGASVGAFGCRNASTACQRDVDGSIQATRIHCSHWVVTVRTAGSVSATPFLVSSKRALCGETRGGRSRMHKIRPSVRSTAALTLLLALARCSALKVPAPSSTSTSPLGKPTRRTVLAMLPALAAPSSAFAAATGGGFSDSQVQTLGGGPPKLCLLYTSPSPRDKRQSRMPSSA